MSRTLTPAELAASDFNPQMDEYRLAILTMLKNLHYPDGWRVVMGGDSYTEKVRLEVQVRRYPYAFRFFSMTLFGNISTWETRRELSAATYQALFVLLRSHPEFLEFETVMGGFMGEPALAAASGGRRS